MRPVMKLKEQILVWLATGKKLNKSHLIVFYHPSTEQVSHGLVDKEGNIREIIRGMDNDVTRNVIGIYNIEMDWQEQLKRKRCFQYD